MPDPDLQQLGRAIRRVRLFHDLSQEELAERAGMNWRHLGEVERGTKDIRWSTLRRIAAALDVPVSRIIEAYESPPPRKPRGR